MRQIWLGQQSTNLRARQHYVMGPPFTRREEFQGDRARREDQKPIHHDGSDALFSGNSILPVEPIDGMALKVIADGGADGRKEESLADPLE